MSESRPSKLGPFVAIALFIGWSALPAVELRVPEDHATIAAAIAAAESGDEIVIAPGEYEVTRPIVFGGKSLTVRSRDGAEATTVRMGSPDDRSRASVFALESGEPDVRIAGLTISGGRGTRREIEVRLPDGKFEVVLAVGGGAVYVGPHAEPVIEDCVFESNTAEYGGAILCGVDSRVTVRRSTFARNFNPDAPRFRFPGGAGIAALADSNLVVEDSVFSSNRAVNGAGIFIDGDASAEIRRVEFRNNTAKFHGGGLFCRGKKLALEDSLFRGNVAEGLPDGTGGSGGGLEIDALARIDLRIEGSEFLLNTAQVGAGISVETIASARDDSPPIVVGCRFAENRARDSGGALYTEHKENAIRFERCRIEENFAPRGGGLFCAYGGEIQVSESIFFRNTAGTGGAAYLSESMTEIDRATIVGNAALRTGGGIFSDKAALTIESSILWANAGGPIAGNLCDGNLCTVTFSCVENDGPWPGAGNIAAAPAFAGWSTDEVYVVAGAPDGGDGTEAAPFGTLDPALAGFDLALAEDSPCLGSGADGVDMGASDDRVPASGFDRRTVHVAGELTVGLTNLALAVSLLGDGHRSTLLRGTLAGLRTSARVEDATVTAGEVLAAIAVASGETPLLSRVHLEANSRARSELRDIIDPAAFGGAGLFAFLSRPRLENVVVSGNEIGAYLTGGADPEFVNTTFSGNRTAGILAAQSTLSAANAIFWEETPLDLRSGSTAEISFSCVRGENTWPGDGNSNVDPDFIDAGRWDDRGTPSPADDVWIPGDFRLEATSESIDRGQADGAPATDLDGRARPCGGGVDRGAYEACPADVAFRRGNVDGDASANIADAIFILNYLFVDGDDPACANAADVDDSGGINIADAIWLLNHLFGDGDAPPPPFDACGDDPTPGSLTCAVFPGCG